jgi:hypothetical protein
MKNQVKWNNHFIENTIVTDVQKIKELLTNSEAPIIIISNGGVFNYEGTFGLVISDDTSPIAQSNGKLYSVDFFESSFRSELYELLAGLLTLESICLEYGDIMGDQRNIHFFSDNKRVVQKVNSKLRNKRTINQHRNSDMDLELKILHEIHKWQTRNNVIKVLFVPSHQDLHKTKHELSHAETLNILADSLTKEARKYPKIIKYHSLPQNPIVFKTNDNMINSKYALRSRKAYHSIAFRKYLQDNYSWSHTTVESIWWKAYHNSIAKLSNSERAIILKFIHDRLPTKARDNKYYSFRIKHCNLCQGSSEDDDHILLCHSIHRSKSREEWFNAMYNYLSRSHTPTEVKTSILFFLNCWLESLYPADTIYDTDDRQVSTAIQQQKLIGWRHFI